ncbi:MAG TPA: DegQ family serine endoprotease [Vicinamibacterales bacterium]|nr:DegQ family serine endoprotease [Vicinamibacterales bacterium]
MTTQTTVASQQTRSRGRAAVLAAAALSLAVGFAGGRVTLGASGPVQAPPPAAATAGRAMPALVPASYSAIVDKVAPAVVTVRVEKRAEPVPTAMTDPFRDFFGPQARPMPRSRQSALGSGVIVSADGRIVTNHHVIDGAERISVDLADHRTFPATLVGSDAASDLAVLHIAASGLPAIAIGDSKAMKVGDVVLAFGNPLGVGQTVTMGIVSATGRATGVGDGGYEDFLQTDAAINQGNSGGALVNMQGELVGINAQILSPSGGNIGLGFAIPSAMVRAVTDQLVRDGVVHRAKLGVTVQPVTPEIATSLGLAEARGGLVSEVEPGGPAERAGVRQGDVIVAIDGQPVEDANALRNQVAGTEPGATVKVDVLRDGHRESLSARLAERVPSGDEKAATNGRGGEGEFGLGLTLAPLTPPLRDQLELPRGADGLVVTDVDPEGAAAEAGIRPGDLIEKVDGRDVRTVGNLRDALAARAGKPSLMLINRHGTSLFLALPEARS